MRSKKPTSSLIDFGEAGIAGHGVFDFVHHSFVENPGVPVWWPGFCATVDLILGGWLAIRLWEGRHTSTRVQLNRIGANGSSGALQ
jgi:hypothetical protein